jgi:hypothetical protein
MGGWVAVAVELEESGVALSRLGNEQALLNVNNTSRINRTATASDQ